MSQHYPDSKARERCSKKMKLQAKMSYEYKCKKTQHIIIRLDSTEYYKSYIP